MSAAFRFPSLKSLVAACAFCALTTVAAESAAMPAGCTPAISEASSPVRIDHDPFAFAASTGHLAVKLRNEGETSCDLQLRFLDASGQALTALQLGDAPISISAREGAPFTGRTGEDLFRILVPPKSEATATFDLQVSGDALPPAGEHRSLIGIEVDGPELDQPLRIDDLSIVLASPPRAQINIAGAAGAFGLGDSVARIDFGDAVSGATKRAFVQVRSNTEARLTFQSANGGRLVRLSGVGEESVIEYSLSFEDDLLDLRQGDRRDVTPPRTIRGQSYPLDFKLGSVGSQMAGEYEDLLTISISPN